MQSPRTRQAAEDILVTGQGPGAIQSVQDPLVVLVADDDEGSLHFLRKLVESRGHRVVEATNGTAAISAFLKEKPDLVLLDIGMPGIDGYQVAEHIRELSGEAFVPVIFVTALSDEASLTRCITCGGSDFVVKPVNVEIMRAKIDGFAQLRRILRTLKHQRDEMASHNRWLKREYEVAEAVFAKAMYSDALNAPNIKYLVSPQAVFNGDLVLAAYRPSGEMHVMIGDFTGHGLSAAIGAIPVADIFHGMTSKGFPISEIIPELNQKLRHSLPPGLFLAAALIELDVKGKRLSVWNGGVPDVVLTRGDRGQVISRFGSRNFPLAVVETAQLDCSVETVEIEPGDHIYLHTDGLIETRNGQGELYGEQRFDASFGRSSDSLPTYDRILNNLQEFRGGSVQSDDVTLIQVIAVEGVVRTADDTSLLPRPATEWQVSFSFALETLRVYDPLPMMLGVLLDAQRLHQHKQRIYMILAELFVNALEHGLLGLDSKLKAGPEGFTEFYREKELRMFDGRQGWVKVEFGHSAMSYGGRLQIRVEDSGPGFDFKEKQNAADNLSASDGAGGQYFGRGISLVQSMCESVSYQGNGNIVEAHYAWNMDVPGTQ